MKILHMVAFLLLVVGGILWAVWGIFSWGIDDLIGPGVAKIVYVLVGLAAIYEVAMHKSHCKECNSGKSSVGLPGGGMK